MKHLKKYFIKWRIIFFAYMVLIGAAYSLFLQKPQANYSQLNTQTLYLDQELKLKNQTITKLNHLIEPKNVNRTEISRLVKQQNAGKIFYDILQLSHSSKLSVESYLPVAQIKHDFYSVRSWLIVVTGSFQQMLHFLHKIERMNALVVCDDVVISSDNPSLSDETLRMSVTINAYCEKNHKFKQIRSSPHSISPSLFKSVDTNIKQNSLENYPLDSLQFVGLLSRGHTKGALVRKPDGSISFVMPGDLIGKEHGKIVSVTDKYIRITEDALLGNVSVKKITTLSFKKSDQIGLSN